MVIDNLERLNNALLDAGAEDEQLDVCTDFEWRVLSHYHPIRQVVESELDVPACHLSYCKALIAVLWYDCQQHPKQLLVNKNDLSLARALLGAQKLREANERLEESKKPHTTHEKKPPTVEEVTALLDGLDPAVIATILANHSKKE